jgi:hypothetical protein
MANFVYITLDTQAPENPTISIDGGAKFTTQQLVALSIGTLDSVTTGYQMLIWGDVDETYDVNVKSTEETSSWIAYNNSKQVKLSPADGRKYMNVKIRDDVHNESSIASEFIDLDMSLPTAITTSPDVSKISKNTSKNTSSFTFSANEPFVEYKVKVVGTTGATHETGVQIPTTNGSLNTSGVGNFSSSITITIKGADLELASSGDGQKIVKVFVKDSSGNWSV